MKKVLLVMMALCTLTWCKAADTDSGDKEKAEQTRQLKGFERIELRGSLDVKYHQGKSFSVVVKAPKKVLNKVETRVEGGKLIVNMRGHGKLFNMGVASGDDVTVYVSSPDLIGVELNGSGDFDGKGHIDTDNLNVTLSGSGDIEFDDIICDRINVSVKGSGDVEVKNVKTLKADIELVGSGDVKMTFTDSGTVNTQLIGSGDIKLRGKVKEHKSQKRGSGTIETVGLIVKNR